MITVLRLGHRRVRDARVSTHCGLVARAFGADGIVYSGEKDEKLLESIADVSRRWGGEFKVAYNKNWRKVIQEFKGVKVHLTMYGLPFQEHVSKLRGEDLLVVVGGEKVPWDAYELSDFNLSVTSQPHSEIAALAVFLDHLFDGKELGKEFKGGLKVIPQARGKIVRTGEEKE